MRWQTMTVSMIAALGLMASLPGSPAVAQQSGATRPPRAGAEQMNAFERRLEDQIYVRLAERAWVGADFKAKVDGGQVTLSGTVPSESTKQSMLRITRRTLGVSDVRDELRVDPAVGALRGGSPVPDAELSRHVAQRIANSVEDAKAGEDWWFTGWRVEGRDQNWTMIVQVFDGAVTLEGEVPQNRIIREAVETALETQGVRSVRSEVEIEPSYARYYPYYGYHPYGYWGHRHAYADPDYFVYYDATGDGRAQGRHTMTGKVTDIDKQKGTVTMETDRGELDLRFPPASLSGVTEGERITVELGLVKK